MYVYMYLYIRVYLYNCGIYVCMCEYTLHVCFSCACFIRAWDRGPKKHLARGAKLTHKRGRNTLDLNRSQHGDDGLGVITGEVRLGSIFFF